MTNGISQIAPGPALEKLTPSGPSGKGGEFQSILDNTIQNLHSLNQDAAGATQKFLNGEGEELHNVVLTAQRAEMAFELGLQVRNKVVQAYQEIMRMQM
jgi:flagellar hook-basal body complex protein FliE